MFASILIPIQIWQTIFYLLNLAIFCSDNII